MVSTDFSRSELLGALWLGPCGWEVDAWLLAGACGPGACVRALAAGDFFDFGLGIFLL